MGQAVAAYAPVLMAASVITGLLTGAVLRASLPLLEKAGGFLTGGKK